MDIVILTGSEIQRERANGRITIEPFTPDQVNPNSYNFRLGPTLRVYRNFPLDPREPNESSEIEIPEDGLVFEPGKLYLAHTVEVLGSNHYAPTFAARSSVARLGIFINLSASLGDIGYVGQWTLQLYTLNRVRLYPGVRIGQMMWWLPRGEIVRYDGKYQGSTGPRPSDIHVDFHKQLARERFPALGAGGGVDPRDVGPKFAALARHHDEFPVPRAFCLPALEFAAALSGDQSAALEEAFADMRATVGAFYLESVKRIAAIGASVRVSPEVLRLIRTRMKDEFEACPGARFAVRSSGLEEDGAQSSLAGVHHSVLGVRDVEGVVAAIEQCWASHYAAPAVAARVRTGDLSPEPRLAVIVQEMIDPQLAGVAFTGLQPDDAQHVVVEYVEGLADGLVAGVVDPTRVTSDHLECADRVGHATLSEVVALTRALRDAEGFDVDVEWAADDRGVHLVQVRPLTARVGRRHSSASPVGDAYSLYFDELPPDFHLAQVAGVYGSYVAKRAPAYRMASSQGVATGAGWVLRFNGFGLEDPATARLLEARLRTGTSHDCVLDVGEALRQIVVPKAEAMALLAELTGAAGEPDALRAAVVRDFIRGEYGLISRLAGRGLAVEYSRAGLMALNRGTSGGHAIVVADLERPLDDPDNVSAEHDAAGMLGGLAQLASFTAAMHERHGAVTLEWVQADGVLYFVDYTVLGADEVTVCSGGTLEISPGTARGRLLRLEDDDLLSRLSIGPAVSIDKSTDVAEYEGLARIVERVAALPEPPIIHVSRPYAVLSVLIGHVAGFVFEHGSILGHLAILLREAGVPAVAADALVGDGDVVISDGTIVLAAVRDAGS